jgi:hypothetical protein
VEFALVAQTMLPLEALVADTEYVKVLVSGIALREACWDAFVAVWYSLGTADASAKLKLPLRLSPCLPDVAGLSGSDGERVPEQDEIVSNKSDAAVVSMNVRILFFMANLLSSKTLSATLYIISLFYIIEQFRKKSSAKYVEW